MNQNIISILLENTVAAVIINRLGRTTVSTVFWMHIDKKGHLTTGTVSGRADRHPDDKDDPTFAARLATKRALRLRRSYNGWTWVDDDLPFEYEHRQKMYSLFRLALRQASPIETGVKMTEQEKIGGRPHVWE